MEGAKGAFGERLTTRSFSLLCIFGGEQKPVNRQLLQLPSEKQEKIPIH